MQLLNDTLKDENCALKEQISRLRVQQTHATDIGKIASKIDALTSELVNLRRSTQTPALYAEVARMVEYCFTSHQLIYGYIGTDDVNG